MKNILFCLLFIPFLSFGQWLESSSSLFVTGYEIEFPALDAAYISGDQGQIFKSTDAGVTWIDLYSFGPFTTLSNLRFLNRDTGFVHVSNGFSRTFDGGINWEYLQDPWGQADSNLLPIKDVKIVGESLFATYIRHDSMFVVKSVDYGDNFEILFTEPYTNTEPILFSFESDSVGHLINPNTLDKIYKTTDGCLSFDTIQINNGDIVLQKRFDISPNGTAFLYGTSGSFSHPTQSSSFIYFNSTNFDGFGVLPNLDLDFNTSNIYASSIYGKIYYSNNNGSSWIEQSTPVNFPIRSIAFTSENNGIAVSGNKVLYTSNGGTIGLNEFNVEPKLSLYPNPASHALHIEGINSGDIQSISIFDSKGCKIKQINSSVSEIQVSGLINGMYFLEIQTQSQIFSKPFSIER